MEDYMQMYSNSSTNGEFKLKSEACSRLKSFIMAVPCTIEERRRGSSLLRYWSLLEISEAKYDAKKISKNVQSWMLFVADITDRMFSNLEAFCGNIPCYPPSAYVYVRAASAGSWLGWAVLLLSVLSPLQDNQMWRLCVWHRSILFLISISAPPEAGYPVRPSEPSITVRSQYGKACCFLSDNFKSPLQFNFICLL
jgi:hypothetical protein